MVFTPVPLRVRNSYGCHIANTMMRGGVEGDADKDRPIEFQASGTISNLEVRHGGQFFATGRGAMTFDRLPKNNGMRLLNSTVHHSNYYAVKLTEGTKDVRLSHNTMFKTFDTSVWAEPDTSGLTFTHNLVMENHRYPAHLMSGSNGDGLEDTVCALQSYCKGCVIRDNIVAGSEETGYCIVPDDCPAEREPVDTAELNELKVARNEAHSCLYGVWAQQGSGDCAVLADWTLWSNAYIGLFARLPQSTEAHRVFATDNAVAVQLQTRSKTVGTYLALYDSWLSGRTGVSEACDMDLPCITQYLDGKKCGRRGRTDIDPWEPPVPTWGYGGIMMASARSDAASVRQIRYSGTKIPFNEGIKSATGTALFHGKLYSSLCTALFLLETEVDASLPHRPNAGRGRHPGQFPTFLPRRMRFGWRGCGFEHAQPRPHPANAL